MRDPRALRRSGPEPHEGHERQRKHTVRPGEASGNHARGTGVGWRSAACRCVPGERPHGACSYLHVVAVLSRAAAANTLPLAGQAWLAPTPDAPIIVFDQRAIARGGHPPCRTRARFTPTSARPSRPSLPVTPSRTSSGGQRAATARSSVPSAEWSEGPRKSARAGLGCEPLPPGPLHGLRGSR